MEKIHEKASTGLYLDLTHDRGGDNWDFGGGGAVEPPAGDSDGFRPPPQIVDSARG
jgi:hypothetical protein